MKRAAVQEKFSLLLALVIAVVLLIAAYAKFFHPLESLKTLDQCVSVVEILLVILLFLFRKRASTWLAAAVLFAAWGGYALFWYYLELPCSCMGAMVEIPSLLSVCVDIFFFLVSLGMGFFLGRKRVSLYLTVLISLFASLMGYAFADWVYKVFILD